MVGPSVPMPQHVARITHPLAAGRRGADLSVEGPGLGGSATGTGCWARLRRDNRAESRTSRATWKPEHTRPASPRPRPAGPSNPVSDDLVLDRRIGRLRDDIPSHEFI